MRKAVEKSESESRLRGNARYRHICVCNMVPCSEQLGRISLHPGHLGLVRNGSYAAFCIHPCRNTWFVKPRPLCVSRDVVGLELPLLLQDQGVFEISISKTDKAQHSLIIVILISSFRYRSKVSG